MVNDNTKQNKVIFMGNGPLAEVALGVLERRCEVIFHARTREDLVRVLELKREFPEAYGVLASFGVMIKRDLLEAFEPEGILNIHPSLLPKYRGASPIESAILAGDNEFSVSVMKLAPAMDAGPVYYQATLQGLPLEKSAIYKALAEAGAEWICDNLDHLPQPVQQDEHGATYAPKLEKSASALTPETDSAEATFRKIIAYQGFPKAKYTFYGMPCAILAAHICKTGEEAVLPLPCADGRVLSVDRLQPDGRKPMDAKSFLNGYGKGQ